MHRHILTKTTAIALGVAMLTLSSATGALAAAEPTAADLRINEIETDGAPDWVELINLGAGPLDLSGFVLTGALNAFSVTVPAGTVVPAGGVYLATGEQFPALKLKKGDTLTLLEPDGVTPVDSRSWGDLHLSTSGLNAAGEFVALAVKTPGALNPGQGGSTTPVDESYRAVTINEVTSDADVF